MQVKCNGKFLSYILRHDPSAVGVELDGRGWADVARLLSGVNKTRFLDMTLLEEIVATDAKGRFSFNGDKTKIRANQGHSVDVNPDLAETTPPDILYHGTAEKFVDAILREGLLPGSRQYVHLSRDVKTAQSVGSRHGSPVVFELNCKKMIADGFKFFLSANGIFLIKRVPPEYLKIIK